MSNPFLTAALAYAARGWYVGRCRAGTKHHFAGGYYDHSIDPDKLRQWWTDLPDANLNISTGLVSGVVSIDIDGPAGLAWWKQRYGDSAGPTIWTPRGVHLLYRCEQPTPTVNLHPEIDLCGDDGQSMMPPSVHPGGMTYEWIIPPDVPLSPLPNLIFSPARR